MDLAIDVRGNRVRIDGRWFSGQRRWEAQALGALIQAEGQTGSPEVTSHDMGEVLRALGQRTAMTRTAYRRLWTSLEEIFRSGGRLEEFQARFQFGPRKLTVGPWIWRAQPADRVEILGASTASTSVPHQELHSVANDHCLSSTLAVVRKLALVHSNWLHGSRVATISELTSGPEWALAAPPILTHRALTLADAYVMVERYDLARRQLRVANELIDAHANCRDQRTFAEFVKVAISGSAERGLVPTYDVGRSIMGVLDDPTLRHHEIDARSRAWAYMHAAHGLRARETGDRKMAPSGGQADWALASSYLSAALCVALVGWHADLVAVSVESHLREIAPVGMDQSRGTLEDCLDIYFTAQYWRDMLDVPRAFEVGRLWMALLAAEYPQVGAMARERAKRGQWRGTVPDSIGFFKEVLAWAQAVEDPKCVARAALALYRYAKRIGQRATMQKAEAEFGAIARQWPTVRTLLVRLGADRVAPELMKQFDDRPHKPRRTRRSPQPLTR